MQGFACVDAGWFVYNTKSVGVHHGRLSVSLRLTKSQKALTVEAARRPSPSLTSRFRSGN
jgi:hypothetical protein